MAYNSESSLSKMMKITNELRRSSYLSYIPESLRGLNVTQMEALDYLQLNREKEVFQKDVEAYLRIRRSSVSTLLHNLEKSGLILREPVPEDARLKKVVLTEQGQMICQAIGDHHRQVQAYMRRILSEEELDSLAHVLEKIIVNMDAFFSAQEERGESVD